MKLSVNTLQVLTGKSQGPQGHWFRKHCWKMQKNTGHSIFSFPHNGFNSLTDNLQFFSLN